MYPYTQTCFWNLHRQRYTHKLYTKQLFLKSLCDHWGSLSTCTSEVMQHQRMLRHLQQASYTSLGVCEIQRGFVGRIRPLIMTLDDVLRKYPCVVTGARPTLVCFSSRTTHRGASKAIISCLQAFYGGSLTEVWPAASAVLS